MYQEEDLTKLELHDELTEALRDINLLKCKFDTLEFKHNTLMEYLIARGV